MQRNPRKVWQYFAQALVQEEDPERITYLTEKLFEALAENEHQPKLSDPASRNSAR